jgi:hypothetical protein
VRNLGSLFSYFWTDIETSEEMKIRLYSLEEYESELGGDTDALSRAGFVAVLKSYRMLDNGWHDYSSTRAAGVLELAPEDYEIEGERSALLLRRLPPSLPKASTAAACRTQRAVSHDRARIPSSSTKAYLPCYSRQAYVYPDMLR